MNNTYDLGLCCSKMCKGYNRCLRGACGNREGIFTESNFSNVCNEANGWKLYIPIDESTDTRLSTLIDFYNNVKKLCEDVELGPIAGYIKIGKLVKEINIDEII